MQLIRYFRKEKIKKIVLFLPNLVRLFLQGFFMAQFAVIAIVYILNDEKLKNFTRPFANWLLKILESENKFTKFVVNVFIIPGFIVLVLLALPVILYLSIGWFFIYSAFDIELWD